MTELSEDRAKETIGYLTNVYPAVSHSFIKREILALEALGVSVRRWSIRPFSRNLPDAADRLEGERTSVVLARPLPLLGAMLRVLATRPVRMWRAIRASMAGRPAGIRAAVVRLAHVAEACVVLAQARAWNVRHIHAHFGTNPASVARLAHLLGGPSYSFTVHGPDEFDQPLVHDLRAKIADARFTVAISQYGRSQLMRWSDTADWPKLAVVRCGLDDGFLGAGDLEMPADVAPTFLSVARLAPQKGLPILLEAVALLKQRGRVFRVVIAGDGELRGSIEQTIARQGLEDCVVLLGAISSEAVRAELVRCRAFVLPSFAEGLPVSIMEALALERPVISTRIAGIPELVDDGCGALIDAGDPDALCAAMEAMLDAPVEQLRAMGRVGRARVLAAHDAGANAAQLHALLERSLSC